MAYVTDSLPRKLLAQEEKERRDLAQLILSILKTGKLSPELVAEEQPSDDWQPPPAMADIPPTARDKYRPVAGGGYTRQRPWTDDPEINLPLGPNARVSARAAERGLLADKSQTSEGAA